MASLEEEGYDVKLVYLIYDNIRVCALDHKSRYWSNPDKYRAFSRKYKAKNRELVNEKARAYGKENKDKLSDYYKKTSLSDSRIINSLSRSLKRENITKELIELKRVQIKLKREIQTKTEKK